MRYSKLFKSDLKMGRSTVTPEDIKRNYKNVKEGKALDMPLIFLGKKLKRYFTSYDKQKYF